MFNQPTPESALPARWLEDYAAFQQWMRAEGLAQRTVAEYQSRLRQFWAFAGEEFTTDTLRRYLASLTSDTSLSAQSINARFAALSAWFRFLQAERGWAADTLPQMAGLKLPKRTAPKRRIPTSAELARLWEMAEGMPEKTPHQSLMRARALAILSLLCDCGLLRGELLALRVEDLTLAGDAPEVRIHAHGRKLARTIPLNLRAQENLLEYLSLRAEWTVGRSLSAEAAAALFPVDCSRSLSNRGFASVWGRLLQAAGLHGQELLPRGVRCRVAAELRAAGSLEAARRILGHRSPTTTALFIHEMGTDLKPPLTVLSAQPAEPAHPLKPASTHTPSAGPFAWLRTTPRRLPRRAA